MNFIFKIHGGTEHSWSRSSICQTDKSLFLISIKNILNASVKSNIAEQLFHSISDAVDVIQLGGKLNLSSDDHNLVIDIIATDEDLEE